MWTDNKWSIRHIKTGNVAEKKIWDKNWWEEKKKRLESPKVTDT